MGQSTPCDANRQIERAADALGPWLRDRGYGPLTAGRVVAAVARRGCVADAVRPGLLLEYDEPAAEAAFVAALPDVPFDDPCWGESPTPRADALPSQGQPDRTTAGDPMPPVCGGGPDADDPWWAAVEEASHYEPSEADWADYRRWADRLDDERAATGGLD